MLVHIVVWRFHPRWATSAFLLIIFLVLPGIVGCFVFCSWRFLSLPLNKIELLQALLLHFSLSSAYIATYPAIQAVSPSLDILLIISSADGRGMHEKDIVRCYTDQSLVGARIDDLAKHSFIAEKQGRFVLTPVSKGILAVFVLYRRLLGLPMGKG